MSTHTVGPRERPDTHEMVVVHRVFRRCFAEMPGLVRGVRPGDTSRAAVVLQYVHNVAGALHNHHSDEDELLWPLLLDRVDLERPLVLKMEEQHARLAQLVERADAQAAAFGRAADPTDGDALATTIHALTAALEEHLGDEERQVLPLVEQRISVPEWNTLAERGREHLSKEQLLVQLGYILDGCSPEEAADFLKKLPLAARIAWRLVGRSAYARSRAELLGT